ncbi:retrotransposon protein, putative, ty1-copia subclass [Tanacetum coccineum]
MIGTRRVTLVLSTEDKEILPWHPIPVAPVCTTWTANSSLLRTLQAHVAWRTKVMCSNKAEQELLQDCEEGNFTLARGGGQSVSSPILPAFVQNFNMQAWEDVIMNLLAMLKCMKNRLPKKDAYLHFNAIMSRGWGTGEKELSRVSNRVDERRSYLMELALQGYGEVGSLKPGGFKSVRGDGHRAAVLKQYRIIFRAPSGLVIVLNNFSKNNLVYFMAVPRDGIFEIDMSCSNTNDSSMYAITNKRAKINLDSSLLWHCRLGHISKKRIEKLQHDGLLNSIDIESLGKCVSCLLVALIVIKTAASYFVTFTDDFSRYGYVYLLKHKHEVFETFKVFQKEVENQLGKTIKSLRSDRGGEYMSQEFLDHLKEHGIIAHRTPPYTPQNNVVVREENRTLLEHGSINDESKLHLPKSLLGIMP